MSAHPLLVSDDLHASVEDTEILKGVSLTLERGEIHALMGPNGSGKSTLAGVLMGHPDYEVTSGRILFKGEDVTEWSPDERGRAGMFLAFQYPEEIPGVSVVNFLRAALSNRTGVDYTVLELRLKVMETMQSLGIDASFADRYLNEGFSGGERKRNEVLQMAVLAPELAIMDETDSGLDIDALRTVAEIGVPMPLLYGLPALALLLADQEEGERAMQLYTLASRYPIVAHSRWFEDVAGGHIATVAASLPPDAVKAAEERGLARDLETTVAELLVELEKMEGANDG